MFVVPEPFPARAERTILSSFKQLCQNFPTQCLLRIAQGGAVADHGLQVGERLFEVVVDDQKVEFAGV